MGCVTSKQTVSVTPAVDHSGAFRDNAAAGSCRSIDGNGGGGGGGDVVAQLENNKKSMKKKKNARSESGVSGSELGESGRTNWTIGGGGGAGESVSFRLGNMHRYVEVEQVAAGWPAWLSAVAGEAIHGWVPLRAESFEKLEKVGQGTYSSVFRARDLEAGKIVALKKVRFDNFEPESVRFMAREIVILRRLSHPNIMKLDGIITSQLSCSIYLVFEYMEHDISGLLSSPDIKFTESQIKCYMKQLLSGLAHCHSRGVMHRDIKGANLLVNNEGVMKIGDFGLANFCNVARDRRPLTSKVVTLWYRPPELLLGSTDYDASVDLWSIGCVFAELLRGVPVLQGRTEVEQMHKIFKLCGSPCDDYWKRSKLPHATLFKPQLPYESHLPETFNDLPKNTVDLIETLLSIEPYKRGTASSALASEYFTTWPYACEPSSLPKYPPNKEIDAKHREDSKRKRPAGRNRVPEMSRRLPRNPNGVSKLAPEENLPARTEGRHKIVETSLDHKKDNDIILGFEPRKPFVNTTDRASQGDIPFSGPLQVSGSSGFAWARRRFNDSSTTRSRSRSSSKSLVSESSVTLHPREPKHSEKIERTGSRGRDSKVKNWSHLELDGPSDGYPSQYPSIALFKKIDLIYQNQEDKVEFSGPLLTQSHQIDELLERHERQVRQAVRRSWLQRGRKNG
ncbi:protein IMPAIRED IN BABA-INDUCED STERILITY 1-like [Cynara cardunculus var. scolymus]|uniref:protein IMPAIRED IN BABA-INDUCED STERILITY 1-like n=1 Tax=Cynara cardunculus var. scolymus TaxID=59895 RepID=UPI000D62868B|nr:protein IMPAIRED IN BABA-INDUCED STERILITY 1-like [Cynara cardunculus var. scolymus]